MSTMFSKCVEVNDQAEAYSGGGGQSGRCPTKIFLVSVPSPKVFVKCIKNGEGWVNGGKRGNFFFGGGENRKECDLI